MKYKENNRHGQIIKFPASKNGKRSNQRAFFPKRTRRKVKTNLVFQGDNLEIMRDLEPNKIQLIYIDPPFCAQNVFKSKTWGKKVVSFNDEWGGGIQSYIRWLFPRLKECHRLLSPTGVFCLHLDYRSVHYAKTELDKIFGYNNLVNEIIWKSANKKNDKNKQKFPVQHNTILIYQKTDLKRFNPYKEHDESYIKKTYRYKDKKGLYASMPLSCKTESGGYAKQKHFVFEGINKRWMYSKKTLERLKKEDRLLKTKNDIRKKVYLSESKGKVLSSLWDDLPVYLPDKEKVGHPTQKPLALLDRLIKAFTKKGDMVFDGFCGCGTTISSAQNLGRQWLGIDISKDAVSVIRKRMIKEHNLKIEIVKKGTLSRAETYKLNHDDFEENMVKRLGGTPNIIKVNDGGIDGYCYDHTPIQVKQSFGIGRPVVDSFYTHVKNGNGRGVIVARSFTKGAYEEVNRLYNEEGLIIDLVPSDDIIRDAA